MMVQDAEKTLAIALESLNDVYDELIVIDGGSQDSTCDIALQYGARLIHNKWSGNHSQQRNVYLENARTDWIFVLDSDEFIDRDTLEFLHNFKHNKQPVETDNFWIKRKWLSPFSAKHYVVSPPHYPDWQRRLIEINKDLYYTGQIHEVLQNLAHPGICLDGLSIYHFDLFINSESKRLAKARKYSQEDPRNGARHFYLPELKKIKLESWSHQDVLEPVRELLHKIFNKQTRESEMEKFISPEIKNDEFYDTIQTIASSQDIKTVLEIGSSSGEGSTEAFVRGLQENPNQPILFCLEVSKSRFNELQKRYQDETWVRCYKNSSIPVEEFPDESEVVEFYQTIQTNLNHYSLDRVISWLHQDIEYIENHDIPGDGIRLIKQENDIHCFDAVLIDGSEFTGKSELERVYGAKYILLDDINSFKNYQSFTQLVQDTEYSLIDQNWQLRNGYAVFKKETASTINYKSIQLVVEAIEGFMVPGQEEYLFNKVKSLPVDAVIVEIGSYKGRSTVAMAYACVGTRRKIYCIDTWDGNDSDFSERNFFEIWQQNVRDHNLEQYVEPLRGYSHELLSRWDELASGNRIDFIFIDGSHEYPDVLRDFELSYPLVKEGGWIAFHDVISTWPGSERVWHETAKLYLVHHEYSTTLACGRKLSSLSPAVQQLPIHFFTIVLNGEPFIRYHIDIFKQLPFKWHWHIIEGVADLKHDTAWSLRRGGGINDVIHHNGRSNDGTTEYLDELARLYPGQVTVYRKPEGVFWNGKREMVNEPLYKIREECLLWQVDVDEFWTVEQICTARQMFLAHPDKTAAYYWCWYFVGENLVINTRNCYTQNPQQEWLRTWKYNPGAVWIAHEPPTLAEPLPNGQWRDVSKVNPFVHQDTEGQGLVFQHFAYVTPEQLRFKEQYYGYANAESQWMALQNHTKFPVLLRDYLPWVRDETMAAPALSCGIVPLAQKDASSSSWRFLQQGELANIRLNREQPLPRIVVDSVFFQLYQTGIARVWYSLLEAWVETGFAKHVIVLDRAGTAPKISGIQYRSIPAYDYNDLERDRLMLQQVCDREGADLFISTYYTTPTSTPSVLMVHDMIPELMGFDPEHPNWRGKHHAIEYASAYIAVSENTARDLIQFFPNISPESITVAHNGLDRAFAPATPEAIAQFKMKYGIAKPYFLLVGAGKGYKNSILFFKAFAQLCTKPGFEVICTGSGGLLDEEFRGYSAGSVVHLLQLSDEELIAAYSGAIALIYPSKYEGFGLPVVEAMACGCPAITCPNGPLPEVGGEAVLYIKDDDVEGLADALCEVQKPQVRQSLITAGLEQAKKFSWAKMAKTVSSALVDATLQPLNLKEINPIVFPDWSRGEESLGADLERVIRAIATHPDKHQITLLIDTTGISEDDASLLVSGVAMNLLMQEDLDVSEGPEISLIGKLGEIQWQALLPRLQARIVLEQENKEAIATVHAGSLPAYELSRLSSKRAVRQESGNWVLQAQENQSESAS